MGKDLKGKELGKGITQESTGLYSVRFVDRFGKKKHKRFKKLQECRAWIAARRIGSRGTYDNVMVR